MLRRRLPPGIAPLIVVLDSLPTRTSGKVDRAALPWPPPRAATTGPDLRGPPPGSPSAGPSSSARFRRARLRLLRARRLLLAVAKLVSVLRRRFPTVTVADVYRHRTLAAMAGRLDQLGELKSVMPAARTAPSAPMGDRPDRRRPLPDRLRRPAWLVAVFAARQPRGSRAADLLGLVGDRLGCSSSARPARLLTAAAVKALLLGRLQPGRHPRRGWVATRVLFLDRLGHILHRRAGRRDPWAPRVARMVGYDVGPEARLATIPSLSASVRIGAWATIEAGVDMHGWWIEGDELGRRRDRDRPGRPDRSTQRADAGRCDRRGRRDRARERRHRCRSARPALGRVAGPARWRRRRDLARGSPAGRGPSTALAGAFRARGGRPEPGRPDRRDSRTPPRRRDQLDRLVVLAARQPARQLAPPRGGLHPLRRADRRASASARQPA